MRSTNLQLEGLPSALKAVHEYWLSIKADRMAPAWKDVDLFNLPVHLVPTTLVIDIRVPLSKSTYRFWGSRLTVIHGVDMTTRHPYDINPKDLGLQLYKDHCEIVVKKCAMAGHYSFFASGGYVHSHSLIRLPLSDDGENVSQILVVIDYSPEALALIRDDPKQYDAIARQGYDSGLA